jgi:hypothetical protein
MMTMNLQALRFSSIMLTSFTMSAAFCHLLEMQPKKKYEKGLYVRLHRTLYPNYGRVAGIAEILSVLSTLGLTLRMRRQESKGARLAGVAAGCLAAAHTVFQTLVSPVNKTMASWPLDSIPDDWMRLRDQWEHGHATRAFLTIGALTSLVLDVVRDTRSQDGKSLAPMAR